MVLLIPRYIVAVNRWHSRQRWPQQLFLPCRTTTLLERILISRKPFLFWAELSIMVLKEPRHKFTGPEYATMSWVNKKLGTRVLDDFSPPLFLWCTQNRFFGKYLKYHITKPFGSGQSENQILDLTRHDVQHLVSDHGSRNPYHYTKTWVGGNGSGRKGTFCCDCVLVHGKTLNSVQDECCPTAQYKLYVKVSPMAAILRDVILNIVREQSIMLLLSGYTPIVLYIVVHL